MVVFTVRIIDILLIQWAKLICLIYFLALCLAFSSLAHADVKEAEQFFLKYQELWNSFDIEAADLYTDNTKFLGKRVYPNGVVRSIDLPAPYLKDLIRNTMPLARLKNDRTEYSNVKYEITELGVKISADRYSTMKCFTDPTFYIIIKKIDGEYKIVESYGTSQPQSNCQ